jgi:integrase
MSRPRRDGTPSRTTIRRKLTDAFVSAAKHTDRRCIYYDEKVRGLALIVQAQPSATKSWSVLYYHAGPRWLSLGRTNDIGLSDARRLAAEIALQVATGKDPAAERRAARGAGTFAELATQYVEKEAKVENRSWEATDRLVKKHLIPKWGRLPAREVSRSDVNRVLDGIVSKGTHNLVLAAASAIFKYGIVKEFGGLKDNPCSVIPSKKLKARVRVLSDSEIPSFWREFDKIGLKGTALKILLLTGQRTSEVIGLRREHVEASWWMLPGKVIPELRWGGTKNKRDHRVWLSEPVRELLAPLDGQQPFGGRRRLIDGVMEAICTKLDVERATPHDLRRTFSTRMAVLGLGRDAMHRLTNHKEGGIGDIYDVYAYEKENKAAWEKVAQHIIGWSKGQ